MAAKSKPYVDQHRRRARENGAVIVYAMLTSPEAINAWKELQKIYGNNRDAIEAAILDSYEQLAEGF